MAVYNSSYTGSELDEGIEIARTNVLQKDNNAAYVPTSDYHPATKKYVDDNVDTKQEKLVSGTNIKTINSVSLLGSGNIVIESSPKATQAEAEAGVNNENYMTPLRVAQLLATLWTNNIVFIVSDTEPEPISGKTIIWVDSSEF